MKQSILEITDQEYLLKLRKEDFDLTLINQILKRIQSPNFSSDNKAYEGDDLKSRHLDIDYSSRFDHLNDK